MRVLIFGGHGWLATEYSKALGGVCTATDIVDQQAVQNAIIAARPAVVINCAGVTGRPNVDGCECNADARRLTYHANAVGPGVVEGVCKDLQVPQFVHISTGCLWVAGNDILEGAPPKPCSYYAQTKAEGEERLDPAYTLILRPRMLFSADINNPRNLISKMAVYTRVLDVINSATFVPDLIAATRHLLGLHQTGIYHVVNRGAVSPADVADMYSTIVDPAHRFERVTYSELTASGRIATGRSSVTLNIDKLLATGFPMPPLYVRLLECMHSIRAQRDQRVVNAVTLGCVKKEG